MISTITAKTFLLISGCSSGVRTLCPKGCATRFSTWAVFPAADLVDVDVVEGGSGVTVVDLDFLCRLFGVLFDWVFGGIGVGVYFLFPRSRAARRRSLSDEVLAVGGSWSEPGAMRLRRCYRVEGLKVNVVEFAAWMQESRPPCDPAHGT